jgi:hypothetical protein
LDVCCSRDTRTLRFSEKLECVLDHTEKRRTSDNPVKAKWLAEL